MRQTADEQIASAQKLVSEKKAEAAEVQVVLAETKAKRQAVATSTAAETEEPAKAPTLPTLPEMSQEVLAQVPDLSEFVAKYKQYQDEHEGHKDEDVAMQEAKEQEKPNATEQHEHVQQPNHPARQPQQQPSGSEQGQQTEDWNDAKLHDAILAYLNTLALDSVLAHDVHADVAKIVGDFCGEAVKAGVTVDSDKQGAYVKFVVGLVKDVSAIDPASRYKPPTSELRTTMEQQFRREGTGATKRQKVAGEEGRGRSRSR